MDQVSWRAANAMIKLARTAGIEDACVLAELPFAADSLPALRWIPWEQYCAILENVEAACGGPEQFEELTRRQYYRFLYDAAPYARALVSPESLLRAMSLFMRPMFPNQHITSESLGGGRMHCAVSLVSDARGCVTYYRGSVAGMAGAPQLLDLPACTVEHATWDDRSLDCVLRLPPSQTVLSRARKSSSTAMRAVASLVDEIGGELRHYIHALSTTHDVLRQQSERMVLINRVGQQLSRQTDLDALAMVLIECLHAHTTSDYVALWTSGADPKLVRESGERPADGFVRMVSLIAGGREVGRLDVAARRAPLDTSFVLDLAPWIAIAVDNSATFASLAKSRAEARAGLEQRLLDSTERWSLTPRQCDVLRLVARGHSNKAAAHALDCAENTVELHVTQLLRKSGSTSRAQLIARFWEP